MKFLAFDFGYGEDFSTEIPGHITPEGNAVVDEIRTIYPPEIPLSPCLGQVVDALMLEAVEDVVVNQTTERIRAAMNQDLDGEDD